MVPQTEVWHACRICDEAITNPICSSCLEEEMTSWLKDREADLIPVAKIARQSFGNVGMSQVRCILCKEDMEVCPHCYTKEVIVGLTDNGSMNSEDFARAFNYDIF